MDIKDIKAIIDLMRKNSVSEFELEKQDFKIRLKRGTNGAGPPVGFEDAQVIPYQQIAAIPTAPAPPQLIINEVEIKSPMIGTFYRSSAPDKPSFVNVGDETEPGKVVCIIEAMKLFNEIESEVKGKIVKVLVEDASPVEFDQPLFLVDPS